MSMIKHSHAISMQYLKKEVRERVHFLHADEHQSFYKLALSFLIEVATHLQSTQNRKLVIFLWYFKKKVSQLLLCSIDATHSGILQESSHVHCYLFTLPSKVISVIHSLTLWFYISHVINCKYSILGLVILITLIILALWFNICNDNVGFIIYLYGNDRVIW